MIKQKQKIDWRKTEEGKKYHREYMREYNKRPEENRKIKERAKNYYQKKKDEIIEQHKIYYNSTNGKAKRKKYMKIYHKKPEVLKKKEAYKNKPKVKSRMKEWQKEYHKTPNARIKQKESIRTKNKRCPDCNKLITDKAGMCRVCIHNKIKGENHHNWLGGKSFEPYDKTFNNRFKRLIRKRDNQICLMCGKHREKLKRALNVHHINYDKKLSILQNCISLCDSCHMTTNFNRKHYTKFFQDLLTDLYGYKYEEGDIILEIIN